MESLTTLYIDKESHKFSAAHYTIFSATERERLHGHNYSVSARIVAPMGDNGFSADYNVYKNRLASLCDALDEYMLLADYRSYIEVQELAAQAYQDEKRWTRMSILNAARCGYFSSDRSMQQYVDDIWHVEPVEIN